MARAKAMDFGTMINGAVEVSAAESKSSKKKAYPQIVLTDKLKKDLDSFNKAKIDEKNAKAEKVRSEASLQEHCMKVMDDQGFAGEYSGTYELVYGDEVQAKFIATDKFSVTQSADDHEEIMEELGEEVYESVVQIEREFVLKADVFKNEELQQKLVKALGKDFGLFFDAKVAYKAKSGLKEKIYKIAGSIENLAKIRTWFSQSKPAIR